MVALSKLIGGGGFDAFAFDIAVLDTSQTWTSPFSGTVNIHCIGAGGGAAYNSPNGGGAAGGYARKTITVSAGDQFTVTVGSGSGPGSTGSGYGGTSSVTGPGVSLSCTGGRASSQASAAGTATGGDINRSGQLGNNSTGGNVDIFGLGLTGIKHWDYVPPSFDLDGLDLRKWYAHFGWRLRGGTPMLAVGHEARNAIGCGAVEIIKFNKTVPAGYGGGGAKTTDPVAGSGGDGVVVIERID